MPGVVAALGEWKKAQVDVVLIGSLAVSYYVRPRTESRIEILLPNGRANPLQVAGFTRTQPHVFRHNHTQTEVEISSGNSIGVPVEIVEQVVHNAQTSNGIKVTSPAGLVAMKLFRLSLQDQADIVALIKTGRVSLTGFVLPSDKLAAYSALAVVAETDSHP
jgi:hypothetical protein